MASQFKPGDAVQTPFGKGVVREVRNSGRLMVDVQGRAMVVKESEISALGVQRGVERKARRSDPETSERAAKRARPNRASGHGTSAQVDLHGMTVEQALDRVQDALNEALLADLGELRFIHGRSGGRIRAALHRQLRETPSVRKFRLDPRNEGVTIVSF
jgi:DNA mismatch repair protein MutS2